MTVRIVQDVARGNGGRRFARLVLVLLGSVLILIGLLAFAWPLLYLLLVIDSLASGIPVDAPHTGDLVGVGATLVITLVGVWLGLRLVRGRRRLGLYLRKFGFGDSTGNVTSALRSAGRTVRLVTLDDAMVAPLGVIRSGRRAAWWLTALALLVMALGLYWALGGPFDDAIASIGDIEGAGNQIGTTIATVFLLALILVLVAIAGALALFGARAYAAARRNEKLAIRTIDNERDIRATARAVAARSRHVLSPRLVVVRVANQVWQSAVRGLGEVCDVVVIDVSHATDPLLWEVTTMKPIFGDRWILVGALNQVSALTQPHALAGTPQGLLANLLDGEEIIAYGPGPDGQRRFARALRRRLYRTRRRQLRAG